jgi:DNA polymerase-2
VDTGFILYPTYDVRDGSAVAQLYGKLDNGETFVVEIETQPFFYIKTVDLEGAKQLIQPLEHEEVKLTTIDTQPVTKILTDIPRDVPQMRNTLHDNNISTYEADIRFSYRQLIDHDLTGGVNIQGEYEKGEYVDRVYTNPQLIPTDFTGELSILSFDIEGDAEKKDLWSVALVTSTQVTKTYIVKQQATNAQVFETEKDLLIQLSKDIQEIDPDIITGWNCIDFDLDFLQEKYQEYNLEFNWSRSSRKNKLRIESDFFRQSSADITGRMVVDGIDLLKWNFVDLESFTLENTAQHYLGEGKLHKGKNRFEEIKNDYENNPDSLITYNLKDAQLVLDILDKSGALTLTIQRSQLTGMPLDRVKSSIASLDMVYLPELQKRGMVAPTSGYSRKDQGITGGFVMDSKPGLYENIIVCDFKSLYPSIMRTLNIDPVSYDPNTKKETSDDEHVRAENGACFKQEQGILPDILANLLAQREEATKQDDQLARFAIKILMNSFFGVLASPNCRFFSMDVSNAITHTGQHLIKKSAEHIQEKYGYDVIYGDTDSIFVNPNTKDSQEATKIGETIEKEINEFFDDYVDTRYKRESKLELEFEKLYVRFMMPRSRGGGGSKKRYAGLLVDGSEEKIDAVGLELVRRDWTALARESQEELLNLIFHDKKPQDYLQKVVDDLRAGKMDDKLVYTKALRKPVSEYTKMTPPHVKAAKLMDEIPDNNLIRYIMTVDGPEPEGNVRHSIDYEHYIDKQLEPVADAILQFFNTSLGDVMKGTSQTTLF